VLPDDRTRERVDDRARLRAEPLAQEAGGVAVGDEADVVAVRLVGHAEAALGGQGAHLGLGELAQRQHRARQAAGG
jgi:hypothetical protein